MRVPLRFLIALVLALEVAFTVVVAQAIGGALTLLWLGAAFVLGIYVMSRAGRQAGAALRGAAPSTGAVAGDSVLLFLAGLLLAIPGFLTDVVALLLLIPPVRTLVRLAILRSAGRRFDGIRSTFTTVRLADGSIVIPGEVVEDPPPNPNPDPWREGDDPPALPPR